MADPLRTARERGGSRPKPSPNRHLRRVNREPSDPVKVFVIRLINMVLGPLTHRDWRGQQHIPQHGGVIIVANHISNVDPLVVAQYLAFSGRWPHYLAKASLFSVPVLGWALRTAGQIPVHRNSKAARQAVSDAGAVLSQGRAVVIYPEGTITLDPELWPMEGRSGAARIALEAGCPVIPVGQWGAQDIMWGKKIHFPRLLPRKTLRLVAGAPISLDDLRELPTTPKTLAEATDRIMTTLTGLVAELRQEQPPARRFDPRKPAGTRAEKENPT